MKIGNYYTCEDGNSFKCVSRYYDPDDCCMFALIRDLIDGELYWVKENWFISKVVKEYK